MITNNGLQILTGQINEKQQKAVELHYEIRRNGELAASAMVEFAKGLKQMRDEKLYLDLGIESFEEYVENAVGIGQRQAYNYIQALEKLGPAFLQSNAKIGITKLQILTDIPYIELDEFLSENNVEELSVRELKELTAKLKTVEEQLTFATAEKDRLLAGIDERAKQDEEQVEKLKAKIEKLKKDLSESEVKELNGEEKAAIEAEIKKKVEAAKAAEIKSIKSKMDETVKAAEKAAEEKIKSETEALEKKYESVIKKADGEKADALARLDEMQKQQKLSASPEIIEFRFYFDEAQQNINRLISIIGNAEPDTASKLSNALMALVQLITAGGSET